MLTTQGGRLNDLMGLAGNLIDCTISVIMLLAHSLSTNAVSLSLFGQCGPIYNVGSIITVALSASFS